MSLDLTDHRGVQEGGDVEDLVESQRRVDAFVLLASAEQRTQAEKEAALFLKVLKQNDLLPPSDSDWKCKKR